jgi:hypothetical protein
VHFEPHKVEGSHSAKYLYNHVDSPARPGAAGADCGRFRAVAAVWRRPARGAKKGRPQVALHQGKGRMLG